MKAHIGVDAKRGLIHSLETTAANEHDLNQVGNLPDGQEAFVFADAGYQGAEHCEELADVKAQWVDCHEPWQAQGAQKAVSALERLTSSIRVGSSGSGCHLNQAISAKGGGTCTARYQQFLSAVG